jgi:hypothetical protein
MREIRTYGSVRRASSNGRPYRNPAFDPCRTHSRVLALNGKTIEWRHNAHSDDRDQSFQRIATSVTRVRDGAVGCCF